MLPQQLLAATPPDVLKGFQDYSAPFVFRGLTETVDGKIPALAIVGWLFLGFGGFLLVIGDTMRTKDKSGDEHLHERVRTWILVVLLVGCSNVVAMFASVGDSIMVESGLGSSTVIASRMVSTAYAMPELVAVFDMVQASKAINDARSSDADKRSDEQNKKLQDALDGTLWGNVKAFGHALLQAGENGARAVSDKVDDTVGAILRATTLVQAFVAAVLKCLLIVASMILMLPMLLLAGCIAWCMEQIRYFLLVSGTAILPLFIGAFGLPAGHWFRTPAQNYVMNMVSICLWPLSWAVGHSGTIAFYNGWLSMIAGTTSVGTGLKSYLAARAALQTPDMTGEQVNAMMTGVMADWLASGLAPLLMLTLGTIGLCVWIILVTILGPKLLHGMLSTGALMMQEAARGSAAATAALTGQVAQTASLAVGPAMGAAGAGVLGGVGGMLSGAASGGFMGGIGGVAAGAKSAMDYGQQVSQAQSSGRQSKTQEEAFQSLAEVAPQIVTSLNKLSDRLG